MRMFSPIAAILLSVFTGVLLVDDTPKVVYTITANANEYERAKCCEEFVDTDCQTRLVWQDQQNEINQATSLAHTRPRQEAGSFG